MEWKRGAHTISTDTRRLDRGAIHAFLRESYWARGIPREVVDRSIDNALCFGIHEGVNQVGFARVVTPPVRRRVQGKNPPRDAANGS